MLVTVQMVPDLIVLGLGARVIVNAVQRDRLAQLTDNRNSGGAAA